MDEGREGKCAAEEKPFRKINLTFFFFLFQTVNAFHILLMTKHFNDVSRMVASEILRLPEIPKRVSVIEKWAAVADICRCLHNFNGVLQICAAFTNSSVFRLKRTWEKLNKTVSVQRQSEKVGGGCWEMKHTNNKTNCEDDLF